MTLTPPEPAQGRVNVQKIENSSYDPYMLTQGLEEFCFLESKVVAKISYVFLIRKSDIYTLLPLLTY